MEKNNTVKMEVADPTALGLFGLAMVTLVASSQKLGLTEGTAFVLPWAIFLGAIAQLIASKYDFKHNNLFGAIVFGAYGLFWLGVSMSWLIKLGTFGEALANNFDIKQLGVAFLGYLIFSIIGTFAAFKLNTFLSIIMIFITLLFVGLSFDIFFGGHVWHNLAAYSELIIALMSFYGCAAAFLNKMYGRVVLPMGKAWLK